MALCRTSKLVLDNKKETDGRQANGRHEHTQCVCRALSSNAPQRIFQKKIKKQRPHSHPRTSAGRPAAAQRPDAGSCALPLVLRPPVGLADAGAPVAVASRRTSKSRRGGSGRKRRGGTGDGG
jgi:hypothetical protein